MLDKHTIIWTLLLSLVFVTAGVAQNHEVTGTVTDAGTGETLPGVNIIIQGTIQGTITDSDGSYSIEAPSEATLVFSYVGYQGQSVLIDGRQVINVAMEWAVASLEEVVAVGYGIRRKETVTGAISTVSGEKLEKAPIMSLSQSLSGQMPGLVVLNPSGEPGADASTIRIRGEHTLNNNEPLIVIDGIPDRAGGLDRLDPKDIESITVLKDASAAIYGARAGNGVILVKTKRGREGPSQFNLELNQGFNQPTRLPEVADAETYLRMLNEVNMYQGNPPPWSEEELQKYADPNSDPWLYPNTDWFEEAIKPMSLQTKANMAVSGGTESVIYRLSFGALTEDGYFKNSATRYNQYNFRSNIDGQITDNISLQFDASGRWEDRNFPTVSNSRTFREIVKSMPHLPARWPNGDTGPAQDPGINPIANATDDGGFNDSDDYYINTYMQLILNVPGVDGLSIRATGSYDKSFLDSKLFRKLVTLNYFDEASYRSNGGDPVQYLSPNKEAPGYNMPQLTQRSEHRSDYLTNLIGEYQKDLEDHSYSILLGTEYQESHNSFFSGFRTNFISDDLPFMFAGGEDRQNLSGSASEIKRLNFFSRLNYSYKNKYNFEIIGRYDGSYIFPAGKRFGFFPGFSAGWTLSEEDFFSNNVGLFDMLKLRASWGRTGNDRVPPYQYISAFEFSSGYYFNIDNLESSIQPTIVPNPDITWEVANQFDVGLEGVALDRRLVFELDYFNNSREKILIQRNATIPLSTGMELPEENIGKVDSWGFDGFITWRQVFSGDFSFDIMLMGGYATNEINFWDEPPGAPEWQQSTGAKMNTGLYYDVIGVFSNQEEIDNYPSWPGARPGDLIFRDVNGDGMINADDRIRVERNTVPDWTGGITLNTVYKQFDFSIFFQGATGTSAYRRTASGSFGNYYQEFADKRWTPENPDAEGPRAFERLNEYWMANNNTYFFRKTDYFRLKTLVIGYTLPPNIVTRVGLENMRIYANGFNLLTWSPWKVGDPEASGQTRGGDYPNKRIFNLGISLTF